MQIIWGIGRLCAGELFTAASSSRFMSIRDSAATWTEVIKRERSGSPRQGYKRTSRTWGQRVSPIQLAICWIFAPYPPLPRIPTVFDFLIISSKLRPESAITRQFQYAERGHWRIPEDQSNRIWRTTISDYVSSDTWPEMLLDAALGNLWKRPAQRDDPVAHGHSQRPIP